MNTTTGVVVGYYLFIIGESKTIIITFDGIGGTLAEATSSFIRFDSAERWTLGEVHRAGSFNLIAVALHEIGHVLGLSHSNNPVDVMAAYYVANRTKLTEGDAKRATELYAAVAGASK